MLAPMVDKKNWDFQLVKMVKFGIVLAWVLIPPINPQLFIQQFFMTPGNENT